MKKTIIAIALATLATGAMADQEYGRQAPATTATATTESSAVSTARGGDQGQQQGQQQGANNAQGQAVNFNSPLFPAAPVETTQNIRYSGTQTVRNVPGVVVSGPASGPCNGASGGLGIAVPGMGIGANFSKVDEGCEERETARIAFLAGRPDLGNLILENTEVVQRAKKRQAARDEAAKKAAIEQPVIATETPAMTPVSLEIESPKQ